MALSPHAHIDVRATRSSLLHKAALQPGDDYADPAHSTYEAVNSFDKSSDGDKSAAFIGGHR
jgi:hypothetical protein